MNPIQDNSTLIDWFKDRLTNPFLFTYSLVFVAYNWKFIGWVLYHPLNFGDKLLHIENSSAPVSLELCMPFIVTIGILIVAPFANNLSDLATKAANKLYNRLLCRIKYDEYVKRTELEKINKKNQSLDNENFELKTGKVALEKLKYKIESDLAKAQDDSKQLKIRFQQQADSYSELSQQYSTLQKDHNVTLDLNTKLEEKIQRIELSKSNLEYSMLAQLANKNYQLNVVRKESPVDDLTPNRVTEIIDTLERNNAKASRVILSFDMVFNHPLFGVIADKYFYVGGRDIYIQKPKSEDMEIKLVFAEKQDHFCTFKANETDTPIEIRDSKLIIPAQTGNLYIGELAVGLQHKARVKLMFSPHDIIDFAQELQV